jgi:MFS transporter, DHA2 family, multidrug resistance protein
VSFAPLRQRPSLNMLILFRVSRAPAAADSSPWRRPSSPTRSRRRSAAWRLRSTESRRSWRPPSAPTLGGWITDNYSWRWIFFINLPVGILADLFLVMRLVEDPPFLRRTKRAGVRVDFIGISLLALGVGALKWCSIRDRKTIGSAPTFITRLVIVSVVCLVGLVIWEWRHKTPIIDVHLFKNFNFATANLMMFILGVLLFGAW